MTGLTGDQIAFGVKTGLRPIPKPEQPDKPGRWRCYLCRFPAWRRGTYGQWIQHWHDHLEEETGCPG